MSSSLITNSDYLINLNSGANTLSIAGTVAITGNLSVSGNSTLSGNILGDRIQNGTTSIDIQTANGNANITIGGTSNVAVFATTGAYVAGLVSVTGNITGNNLVINSIRNDDSSFINIEDGVNVNGEILATGNITGNNLVINSITSDDSTFVTIEDGVNVDGEISATGNITGGNISTAGVVKTGVFVTGTIPTAAGVGAGARAFVTDADSVTFGNLYTGGSGNSMPVWSNGTSWYVG
jgi:hypothetical protein